ncbi:MAG: FAD-dependent oxidoreductase [Halieaceae bacterium]|jgi:uncharacterized protein with NAD-binding domain and iron-sulfur cluster|nr:FAD-dependent oxidoreductase [Halieaceae bacterium]
MAKTRVVVIGGGVGGMSAAHELVTRGYDVEVYELHSIPGGKARSYGVKGTAVDDKHHDLPAEHGFRFFPGYYKHVIDTMENIPLWGSETEYVSSHLRNVDAEVEASFVQRPIILPASVPHTFVGLFRLWRQQRGKPQMPVGLREGLFYMGKLWQILTSCHERREQQYEQIPWWEFIEADRKSTAYQRYLGNMTRTLVAANPHKVSTRTNGNNWLQVLQGMFTDNNDRVLDGPTNEVWIHPWLQYLIDKGVRYYVNAEVTDIRCDGEKVTGIEVREHEADEKLWHEPRKLSRVLRCDRYGITEYEECEEKTFIATGDYYISAVPVERMTQLVADEKEVHGVPTFEWRPIAGLDPAFEKIPQLSFSVAWMNGLQFYLKPRQPGEAAPTMPGHAIYVDAPFALTSIFQSRYWENVNLSDYGDGTVESILSVDISNWSDGIGRIYDKPAFELSRQQVKDEVWEDIKVSLRTDEAARIEDDNLVDWFLDFDIKASTREFIRNKEPLLINRVNTWRLRPKAFTAVPNLCIASDYVQTNTDLATMEGANEAARRAVNYILQETQPEDYDNYCRIWPLEEPDFLVPFRSWDRKRFYEGKDWSSSFPILMKLRLWGTLFLIGMGLKSL